MISITWNVDDGYVGKSRPQNTEIDLSELVETLHYEGEESLRELIFDYVQEDFEQKVSFFCDTDSLIEEVRANLEESPIED